MSRESWGLSWELISCLELSVTPEADWDGYCSSSLSGFWTPIRRFQIQ